MEKPIPYSDDCIIFFRTAGELIESFRDFLQPFKDANLKVNPLKDTFFQQQVLFLCHIVSRDGIQADPAKTSAVGEYSVAQSVTENTSFLGLGS